MLCVHVWLDKLPLSCGQRVTFCPVTKSNQKTPSFSRKYPVRKQHIPVLSANGRDPSRPCKGRRHVIRAEHVHVLVIPAKAGIQRPFTFNVTKKNQSHWIPAFAGMTSKGKKTAPALDPSFVITACLYFYKPLSTSHFPARCDGDRAQGCARSAASSTDVLSADSRLREQPGVFWLLFVTGQKVTREPKDRGISHRHQTKVAHSRPQAPKQPSNPPDLRPT